MDVYTMTQITTAGLVLGLCVGVPIGWSLCDYVLRRLLIELAETRLTFSEREQFGNALLKIMGKS